MPNPDYHGAQVPVATDVADGPKAFREFVDHFATIDSMEAVSVPVGTLLWTVRTTPDLGYVMLDGSTVAGAQTLYPVLWPLVPASWHSGVDLILPDCRGRILIGLNPADTTMDTIGEKLGAKTATIGVANLPAHAHTMVHSHNTLAGGEFVTNRTGEGAYVGGIAGSRDTTTAAFSGNTGNTGSGTALPIMPPVIAFGLQLRAA